ncbi:MAG: hypothetical protein ACREV9_05900 [Burkholderiales bacterium]
MGETAPQIADYARDNSIDKIVMGGEARRGRGNAVRFDSGTGHAAEYDARAPREVSRFAAKIP